MMKVLISVLSAALIGQVFLTFGLAITFFFCLFFLMTYAFAFHFKKMFVFFIILRPAFDIFGGAGVHIGNSNVNLAAIMSILFIVGGFFYIIVNKKRVFVCNEVIAYICFLIFSIAGTLYNISLVGLDGVFAWLRLVVVLVVMLVIFHDYTDARSLTKLMKYILFSSCIPIIYAIIQIFTKAGITYGQGFERVNGGFSHGNIFATYLVLFIVLIFSILSFRNTIVVQKNAIYLWVLLVLMSVCLFLTFARGAWISLGASLMIITALYSRKKLIIGLMLLIFLVLSIYFLSGKLIIIDEVLKRFADLRLSEQAHVIDPTENSFSWRVLYWKELAFKLKDSPIFGFGLGSVVKLGSAHMEAHNNYLQVFFESGIGGFFYFAMIIMFFLRALIGVRCSAMNVRAYSIGVLGVIIAYSINSISGHLVRNAVYQIYFVISLMMLINLINDSKGIRTEREIYK